MERQKRPGRQEEEVGLGVGLGVELGVELGVGREASKYVRSNSYKIEVCRKNTIPM
jgi:hypothetical protein